MFYKTNRIPKMKEVLREKKEKESVTPECSETAVQYF